MELHSVKVCFTPALYPYEDKHDIHSTVVIDVFRATTSMIAAIENGAEKIIPTISLQDARSLKNRDYLLAGEQDGQKLDFADFGNSPLDFSPGRVNGKTIVFFTTNGTKAIEMAKHNKTLLLAAFTNIEAISGYLSTQGGNVLLFCAGWKNNFSLEDTLCAGAIIEKLVEYETHRINNDAAIATYNLWLGVKSSLKSVLFESEHAKRLMKLGFSNDIDHCLQLNSSGIIPAYNDGGFIKINNVDSVL
jgi:2-phosphosulfolactate phosphatase